VIDLFPQRQDRRGCRPATCEQCGQIFAARSDRPTRFCGRPCYLKASGGRGSSGLDKFIHHGHDAAKKVRANGLINRRIKLGMIERPTRCELCGITARTDACHIDYDLPDVVTFACRSCHMKGHYDPAVDAAIRALAKSRGGPVCTSSSRPRLPPAAKVPQTRRFRLNEQGVTEYRCTKCQAWKAVDDFPRLTNPASRCKVGSWCSGCANALRARMARDARRAASQAVPS
jgi:hypothetical protein